MKIEKDELPKDCICCQLSKLKICGKPYAIHVGSGAVRQGMKPDSRCELIRK